MKELTQANYNAIRDHLFDRMHTTGEQIKNDFPNTLRWAIQTEAWTHFTKADGQPFANLVEWLHYTYPNGASMGHGLHVITYEDALQLTEVARDVQRTLAENPPNRQDSKGNLRRAKSAFRKMSPAERTEFLKWMNTTRG